MTTTEARATGNEHRGVAAVLFLALFSAQASVIVLSPVLARVASDLGVSTAAAGQLRTLSGLAAGATALAVPRLAGRTALRTLLLVGAGLLAAGSLASAVAPSFAALAAAQMLIGVAVAVVVAVSTTAAAAWAPEGRRTQVLSWALIGQPAAWIVGMPLVGALGERSWRYGWLALPLVASLLALALLARRRTDRAGCAGDPGIRRALRDRDVARWALAELLANCGWAGTLVYAGALFVESYGTSGALTGVVLAAAAAAYVAGNLALRRLAERRPRQQLVRLSLALALAIPLFGVLRAGVAVSTLVFALAAFVAGGRTLIGNAVGLAVAPGERLAAMGVRAAAVQIGYFVGSGAAGLALGLGGYPALGIVLGAFFVPAALALVEPRRPARRVVIEPAPREA